jgi:uncharacterized membrane protein YdjX (TVP38/TMEM64 family)
MRVEDAMRRANVMRWGMALLVLFAGILVPFALWDAPMATLAADWVRANHGRAWMSGAAVVALLAADVVLPVPSSLVSTLAGYRLGIVWGTLASALGMTLGCLLGYLLGARAGTALLHTLVPAPQQVRLAALTDRWGDWVVIIARPIPVLAEASVIAAGASGLRLSRFMLVSTAANIGIAFVYAVAGAISATAGGLLWALVAAIGLPAMVLVAQRARGIAGRAS